MDWMACFSHGPLTSKLVRLMGMVVMAVIHNIVHNLNVHVSHINCAPFPFHTNILNLLECFLQLWIQLFGSPRATPNRSQTSAVCPINAIAMAHRPFSVIFFALIYHGRETAMRTEFNFQPFAILYTIAFILWFGSSSTRIKASGKRSTRTKTTDREMWKPNVWVFAFLLRKWKWLELAYDVK